VKQESVRKGNVMEIQFKNLFLRQWKKYFPKAELPLAFYYTNEVTETDIDERLNKHRCLICNLNSAREGKTYIYHSNSPGCPGGKRYTGYSQNLHPNFEYFLSWGIPGEMEGERYKKTPELVREFLKNHPPFKAPARYLVFKRWDKLSATDRPLAVIFYANGDVLSGLYTLANFDVAHAHGVIAPMGSGCSSIVNYPLEEANSDQPCCILGMFDVSARPCVPQNTLTFTIPMKRFLKMVQNMDKSFLITQSWNLVRTRIK
jgi:hypothetical protein